MEATVTQGPPTMASPSKKKRTLTAALLALLVAFALAFVGMLCMPADDAWADAKPSDLIPSNGNSLIGTPNEFFWGVRNVKVTVPTTTSPTATLTCDLWFASMSSQVGQSYTASIDCQVGSTWYAGTKQSGKIRHATNWTNATNTDNIYKEITLTRTIDRYETTRYIPTKVTATFRGYTQTVDLGTIKVSARPKVALTGNVTMSTTGLAPGQKATCTISGSNAAASALQFQWRRGSTSGTVLWTDGGRTSSTYTLTEADLGSRIYCVVTSSGTTGSKSAYTGVVSYSTITNKKISPGYYWINSSSTQKLNVQGGFIGSPGTNVQTYNDNSIGSLWKVEYANGSNYSGGYYIKTPDGYCLDVVDGRDVDDANVWIANCWNNQTPCQTWRIGASVGSYGKIQSFMPKGKYLGIKADVNANGTNVLLHGSALATWKLTAATPSLKGTLTGGNTVGSVLTGQLTDCGGGLNLYQSPSSSYIVTYSINRDGGDSIASGELTAANDFKLNYTIQPADMGHTLELTIALRTRAKSTTLDRRIVATKQVQGLPSASIPAGWYFIKHTQSGRVLNVGDCLDTNNANVMVYDNINVLEEMFYVSGSASSGYTIKTAGGKALDVVGGTDENNADVNIYDSNGSAAQKWYFEAGANQSGKIMSGLGSHRLLGLTHDTAENGRQICLYDTAQARWTLVPVNLNGKVTPDMDSAFVGSQVGVLSYDPGGWIGQRQGETDDPVGRNRFNITSKRYTFFVNGVQAQRGTTSYYTTKSTDANKSLTIKVETLSKTGYVIASATSKAVPISSTPVSSTIDPGWYWITASNGKALDVAGGGIADGTNVQLYDRLNSGAQLWYVSGNKTSGYTIKTPTGKALDVDGGQQWGDSDGRNVQIWTPNNTPGQTWRITAPVGSYGMVQSTMSGGRLLAIQDDSALNGANVIIWSGAQARWRLTKLAMDGASNLSGSGVVGEQLIALPGGKDQLDLDLWATAANNVYVNYQFYRDGVKISGASGRCPSDDNLRAYYKPTVYDVNKNITCKFSIYAASGQLIGTSETNPIVGLSDPGDTPESPGDKIYYTSSTTVEAESGAPVIQDGSSRVSVGHPVNRDTLCTVGFDNGRTGSFRVKNVSTDMFGLDKYDLIVTVHSQTPQVASGVTFDPPAPGARIDSVFFGFCPPTMYPSEDDFAAKNKPRDTLAMWMKTWYHRTDVTIKLVKPGTTTAVTNMKMWGRITDIDITPGYTKTEWGDLVDPASVSPSAYYAGAEFVRAGNGTNIYVPSDSRIMQDAANRGVYSPREYANDTGGTNYWACRVEGSSYNGTLRLEYGGTNCGVNYNFAGIKANTSLKSPSPTITKSAYPKTVDTGDTVTYTLTAYNRNGSVTTAEDFTITDSLPTGLSLVSASADLVAGNAGSTGLDGFTQGTPVVSKIGNKVTVTQKALGGSDKIVVTIKARVTQTTSGSIRNWAFANCDGGSQASDYDDITVRGTVTPRASLLVTKDVDQSSFKAGDTVTYTITTKNTSSITATNVVVKDALPGCLTPVSTSRGTFSGNTLTVNYGSLPAGSSFTTTVKAKVKEGYEGQSFRNTATGTCSNGSGDSDYADAVVVANPKLSIVKTSDSANYEVGDEVRWTVSVSNVTPNTTAENVKISDIVPAGITVTSAKATASSGKPTVKRTGNDVTVTLASLAYGQSINVELVGTAGSVGTYTNKATTTCDNGTGGEASSTITVSKPSEAALSVDKQADSQRYTVGDEVTYTITVTNTTTTDATGVVVKDVLPASLQPIEASIGSFSGNAWTYNKGDLLAGTSITMTVKAKAIAAGVVDNTASATLTNGQGGQDTETITVYKPALSVEKTANKEAYEIGDQVVYTINVKNTTANSIAKNVKVSDAVPSQIRVLSVQATSPDGTAKATNSGNAVTATASTLAYNEIMTITVTGEAVAASDAVTNRASASCDNGDPGEGEVTVKVTDPKKPTVEIEKTAEKDTYAVGETAVWNIKVTNVTKDGSGSPISVTLTDTLPSGMEWNGEDGWTLEGGKLTKTVSVPAEEGASVTATLKSTVTSECGDTATNNAVVTWPDGEDEDDETVTVVHPALSVVKTASTPLVQSGGAFEWTVTVKNTVENSIAKNVVVTDQADTSKWSIQDVAVSPASVSGKDVAIEHTAESMTATIAELPYGQAVTFTISAKAAETWQGDIENTARATGEGVPPAEDDAVTTATDAAVAIVKTAEADQVEVGKPISWKISVVNTVPGTTAHNVTVTDKIPAGLENVQATAGEVVDGTLTWNIGDVAFGQSKTVTLTADTTAEAIGQVVNTAVVKHDGGEDDDTSTVIVTQGARYELTKTADKEVYKPGETITWDVTLKRGEDLLTGSMQIDGAEKVGATFTATVTGAQEDAVLGYQWYRIDDEGNESKIAGGVGTEYTTTNDDAGYTVTCKAFDTTGKYAGEIVGKGIAVADDRAWALLYEDGTLSIQRGQKTDASHGTLVKKWTGFETSKYESADQVPWSTNRLGVNTIEIKDPIAPVSMAYWFYGMENCASMTGLERIDTSSVESLKSAFSGCASIAALNGIDSWNVGHVASMIETFSGCTNLGALDLSSWNVSNVVSMTTMFGNCTKLTSVGNLSDWDFSSLDSFGLVAIFGGCSSLQTLDISDWNVASQTNLSFMFSGCTSLTSLDLSGWNTEKATDFEGTFEGCANLKRLDISGWNTSSVRNPYNMFNGAIRLEELTVGSGFGNGLGTLLPAPNPAYIAGADGKWYDTATGMGYSPASIPGNVATTYVATKGMLPNLPAYAILYADGTMVFQKGQAEDAGHGAVVGKWTGFETEVYESENDVPWSSYRESIRTVVASDRIRPESMQYWFTGASNLASADLSQVDTSVTKSIKYLFTACKSLTTLNITGWNTSNIKDMSGAFGACARLTSLDLSNWNTSSVTDMTQMFSASTLLSTVGDISGWNLSNATSICGLFAFCPSYVPPDLSSWDTSNVSNMSGVFSGCSAITSLDLSGWDVSNVEDFSIMFGGCSSLESLDLSTWETSSLNNNVGLFTSCKALREVKVGAGVGTNLLSKLPEPDPSYIEGADGKWYDVATSEGYAPSEIPGNKPATYLSSKNLLPASTAILYSDGTMVFQMGDAEETGHGAVVGKWTGFDKESYSSAIDVPWNSQRTSVKTIKFKDALSPVEMTGWFSGMSNCVSMSGLEKVDTSNVTSFKSLFWSCSSLTFLDLSGWDTSNVEDMTGVFAECHNLASINGLEKWNTSNVTSLEWSFGNCHKLSNVADNGDWKASDIASFNLSGWDTSKVKNLSNAFYNCSSLTSLDLSGWNTASVTDAFSLAEFCTSLTSLNLSSWDTSKITNASKAFYTCYSIEEISVGSKVGPNLLSELPTPHSRFIAGADGKWYDKSTGTGYTPNEIPGNVATTYVASPELLTANADVPTAGSTNGLRNAIASPVRTTTASFAMPASAFAMDAEPLAEGSENPTVSVSDSMQAAGTADPRVDGASTFVQNGTTFDADLGSVELAPGESKTWKVTATVTDDAPDTISNKAVATLPDGSTIEAESTVRVERETNLSLTKDAERDEYAVGETVTWTVDLTNNGPSKAHNWSIKDVLPAQTTFQNAAIVKGGETMATFTQPQESYTGYDPNRADETSIGVGETVTLVIAAKATTAGVAVNNATASADYADDVTAQDTVTIVKPTVTIEKKADATKYSLGDTVTYTITVQNTSTKAVNNVVVTDTLPDSLTPVSTSAGSFSGQTLTWNIGTMAAGAKSSVTVKATANAAGIVKNIASVTIDGGDPVTSEEVVEVLAPALEVTKTASSKQVEPGSNVTWTIEVTNTVEGTVAKNVVVTDTFPAGFTASSWTAGSVANGVFTWNVGDVAFGETKTVTITGKVAEDFNGQMTNTAVATSDNTDPAQDSETITGFADRTVTYVVDVSEMLPDGEKVFTETVQYGMPFTPSAEATAAGTRADCERFEGWFTDPACTKPYVAGPIKDNLTLYGRNWAKIEFAWAVSSKFPGQTDPMYSKPDDKLEYAIWDPYRLPLYKDNVLVTGIDGEPTFEVAYGEKYTVPAVKDPTRYTWGGLAWLEYNAHCWYKNEALTDPEMTLPGSRPFATANQKYWCEVTKSRYDGTIG